MLIFAPLIPLLVSSFHLSLDDVARFPSQEKKSKRAAKPPTPPPESSSDEEYSDEEDDSDESKEEKVKNSVVAVSHRVLQHPDDPDTGRPVYAEI